MPTLLPRPPSRPGFLGTLLSVGLLAAGCAPLPTLSPPATARPAADYGTEATFAAAATAWPAAHWWSEYGDAQLNVLIEEALANSPDMAAAASRLRRAEALQQVAGAALAPRVDANGSISEQKQSYNHLMPRSVTPAGWHDYGLLSLDFSWQLDFWGRNRAALAAALSQRDAARAEFAGAGLVLAAAIASDYADLARLYAVRDTVERSVAVRGETVALFAQRYANGLETKGGLSEAEARRAASEGELLTLDEQIGLQRNRLAALLGAGPDRGRRIARPTVALAGADGLPANLAADLLGRRPDIVAARLRVEALSHRVEEKKAAFYPNVNLSAFIGLQALGLDRLTRSGSDVGAVGPALSLPIFSAGRLQGDLRAEAAGYDEAVADYDRTVTRALQEVADAGLSRRAATAQVAKAGEAVAAAEQAYQVARNRYEGGLASHLEVLYAEDGLLANQRNLAALQSRAFILDVALKQALGGGYLSI
ncbi:efflux transporter outer membrane subunit [Parasulfuritortus cantonensis]|uniref:Efflux transporter outer membrane subunit n=1 Tax=Parasulfuritortus cantonensis TaxID=2528202 RepID=A0A4R1B4A3_9PROT|nr:efflux transporter outer membrane subunit [Parasulfuritortus cantonensis]TCJ12751.1 efflux transporter outer membrane subunit [Parasulfuritortus cantonensis]